MTKSLTILMSFFPLFFQSFAIASSMDLPTLQNKYPSRHFDEVQLPSGRTHYQSLGNGPVVILVHGVSGPLAVWDKSVDGLVAAGYRVIRYDLFGRGFSERLTTALFDLDTYETQLTELSEALHLGPRIRLVGSSLGAIIVSEYALRHSKNIAGLILVGPAGFPITVPFTARLRNIPLIGDILTYFLAYRTILKQNDHYFVDGRVPEELRPFIADQLSVAGTTDAILKTMQNSPVQSFVESYRKLGKAGVPVGVIWGRKDDTFPYENSRILMEAVPQANLVTVENAGHLPQYERGEAVSPILINLEKGFN
jgi:pimeloyl-ACP methyl ester carboxylesterase